MILQININTACVLYFICSFASAAIVNGNYTTIDGSVTLPVPQGVTDNEIRQQDDGQGITARCIFMPKIGPISGIYSTKIRQEFPKTDQVLDRTAARYRQNIRAEDGSTLEHIEKISLNGRTVLLSIVRHIEMGNATRLKDTWLKNELLIRADVLEARLYLIHKGYFIEYKRMLLPELALNMGADDENKVAAAAMKGVIEFACSSNALDDNERRTLMNHTIKDEYIVGVYKDPSLEVSSSSP